MLCYYSFFQVALPRLSCRVDQNWSLHRAGNAICIGRRLQISFRNPLKCRRKSRGTDKDPVSSSCFNYSALTVYFCWPFRFSYYRLVFDVRFLFVFILITIIIYIHRVLCLVKIKSWEEINLKNEILSLVVHAGMKAVSTVENSQPASAGSTIIVTFISV